MGGPGTAAPSGSSSNAANSQILKKSSAYWVATTHVQYNLDMADINIAANRTAEAKANMDSAAAAYFGCGDTNPVPLPKYKGTQITYPTTAATTDIGSNATTMSIYGVANKRAANYLTAKAVPGGTSSATSPGTTKTVAELNIEVGTAFNAATLLQPPYRLSGTPPTPSSLRLRSGTLPRLPWRLICPATAWAVPQDLLRISRHPRRTPPQATGGPLGGSGRKPKPAKSRQLLVVG